MKYLTISILFCAFIFCCSSPLAPIEQEEYLINFDLPRESYVKVIIENNYSTTVRTIIDELCPAGYYSESWDLRDSDGNKVYEGIYYIHFYIDGELFSTKTILLRN